MCRLSGTLLVIALILTAGSTARQPSTQQRVTHALQRLTWGPRPGDAAVVQAKGLDRWIDEQLNPETLRESEKLEKLLAPLESLKMSSRELMEQYPAPQVIRAYASGRTPLPSDPEKRAVIERLIARQKRQDGDPGGERQEPDREALAKLLSPAELRGLRDKAPEERMSWLASLPADRLDSVLAALPQNLRRGAFALAPSELRRKMMAMTAPAQVPAYDLLEAKLLRAVYTERQLEDVLTDFWFNHFNVFLDKGADRYLVTSYERDAIRPHVLGKFRDMLQATAEHPAMLWYLDNWQSVGADSPAARFRGGKLARGLNENYGRELLELHTLGVDGGYTQKDVTEVARCFTGWTIRGAYRGEGFQFNDRMHDQGEKTVLGVRIPSGGGKEDGLKVLDLVARHPSTARFLSRKLAQRFVSDNPPEPLVAAMAKTFTKTDGDLRAVMKTMLASREFWAQEAVGSKVKSPLELVVSAVRASGAEVGFAYGLANKIGEMGQPLYRKVEPTGYPNAGQEWVNSAGLLARMNFATALAQNKLPGVKVAWSGDPTKMAPGELSAQTKTSIENAGEDDRAAVAGLILGSPEFQRK